MDREVNPNGTIYRTVFDGLGRATGTWFGTGAADGANPGQIDDWPPGASWNNMVELSANVYDHGGAGDSNLTETIQFPLGNGVDVVSGTPDTTAAKDIRVSEMAYDWLDRLVALKDGALVTEVDPPADPSASTEFRIDGLSDASTPKWLQDSLSGEGTGGDKIQRRISVVRLDNLGEVTNEYVFAGNQVDPAAVANYVATNPNAPNYNGLLRSDVAYYFDARGREYKTSVYNVNQSTGAPGSAYATTLLTFDPNDNAVQIKDPMSNYTTMTYDGLDRMTTRLDPNKADGSASGGALTLYFYDFASNLTRVIDANNHQTDWKYDAADRLIEIDAPTTDALQSGSTDASLAPTAQSSTLYKTGIRPKTTYVYGNDGLVSTVTDPNGNLARTPYFTTYHHDALGRTTSIVSPQVNILAAGSGNGAYTTGTPTESFTYDGDSNLVSSTNANNATTNYGVDLLDNVVQVAPPGTSLDPSNPGKGAIYAFDNLGDLLSVQTADGTTSYAYNTLAQQNQITQPQLVNAHQSDGTDLSNVSPVKKFTFDALGNVSLMTDANANYSGGYTTTYAHDGLSRLTGVTRPAPNGTGSNLPTLYGYNADSELTSVTDPLNNVTSIDWFHNGLEKKLTLPSPSNGSNSGGPVYQYDYYAGGQLKTVTDPFNYVTTYEYSSSNQLSKVTLPTITVSGAQVTPIINFYHDANGNQTAETDPDSNSTYYNFDALNRLSEKREYVGLKLDPTTNYTTQISTNAASGYLYDAAGNLTRATDADGRVVGYDYNGLGQRTAENWFTDANAASPTNTIGYDYYAAGELHHASDAFSAAGGETGKNSAYTFVTDALGRVTQVDNNGGSTSGTPGVADVVLNAKYDLNGNRTALNAQVDSFNGQGLKSDFQNGYMFDRLNRPTQIVQQSAGGGYGVAYKKTALNYYNDSRLQTITDSSATATVVTGSLSYDHVGRITGLSWYGSGGGYGGSSGYFEQMSWGYDSNSRVASFSNASYINENLQYTYDHDNQLLSAAASYGGYGGGSYSWDGNGDPTGKTVGKGNRLLADGTYRYEYDNSGHMTKRTAISGGAYTVYGWDNRGHMVTVTNYTSGGTVTQTVSLWYDAFNDLIGRTLLSNYQGGVPQTTATARFVYDLTGSIVDVAPDPTTPGNPSAAAGQGNAVLAFNGNGSLTDRFLWGPAVDQILADERYSPSGSNVMPSAAGTTYWALGDNENSVRDWITYGALVDHIVYDSFGKVYSQTSTAVPFNFMHNGVFYDPASGLEYHSQSSTGILGRWYNPSIQRWMSEDPSGLGPDSNQYRYVGNSPTNGTDPTGLFTSANHRVICHSALKSSGLNFAGIKTVTEADVAMDDGALSPGRKGPFWDPLNHGDNNLGLDNEQPSASV
jgi:RHS repeat-associated protein